MHLSMSAMLLEPFVRVLPKTLAANRTSNELPSTKTEAGVEAEIAMGFLSSFICIESLVVRRLARPQY